MCTETPNINTRTLFGTEGVLGLQPVSSFNKPAYSLEDLALQFFIFTSVIESQFVLFDEVTLEVLELTFDE